MAVVRIDDDLLKKIKQELKKEENRYKYGSIASFINSLIHEKLQEDKDGTR